jgi:hypothetical protein
VNVAVARVWHLKKAAAAWLAPCGNDVQDKSYETR